MSLKLKTLTGFLCLLGIIQSSFGQTNIANYSFTTTTGATYTPITGGTAYVTGTYDNTVSASIAMGGTFTFGGTAYTACYISPNGYITFGAAPAGTTYTPFSVLGSTTGAISAFGQDGASSTATGAAPEIRYQNTGTEFVVQFKDHANWNNRTERLNFQIRLTFATGAINIVYGSCTNPGTTSTTGTTPQVGIRGNSTTYASNVNALMIGNIPANTTCDWSNAVSAYANSSSMLFSGTTNVNVKIPTGLTYTWTPGTQAPVRTFSAVTGVGSGGATVSWTAASGATGYNVQYRVPGTCSWTDWSGNPVATNTVTLTGLAASTTYQVRVQAINGSVLAPYSHIPNSAGTGDGYTATGTFTTASLSPTLVAGTLTAFGSQCINNTYGPNSFTLTGTNLTNADVTIAASSGYTYSTTSGGTYTPTLTLTQPGGTLNQTVFVKFTPTAVATYNTNISISGGGASAVTVTPSGSGVNTTPTGSVSGATAGSITLTGATINGASISALGCSNVTAYGIEYSTSASFTAGTVTQVAGTGFSGSAGGTFSAVLTGLNSSTTYYYRVYATNAGGTSTSTSGSFITLTANQIGTGTATSANYPIYSNYGFSYSQQIYLASEVNAVVTAGQRYITKIRFRHVTAGTTVANYNNWTVFMGNTSKNVFTTTSDWVPYSDLAQVYTGTVTPVAATWMEITLATPFLWDGTSNIVVAVDENASGFSNSTWQSYTASSNRAIQYYSDSTNPNPASPPTSGDFFQALTTNLSQIQFTIAVPPNCFPVSGVSASATSSNSGTASWTAPSGGDMPTGYEWEVRTTGAAGSGSPTASGTPTGTTATITGLTPNTTYSFYVRTNCGGTYSTWSSAQTFTTQPITAIASGDFATGSNWNNGTGPVCGQLAVIPNGMAMTVTSGTANTGSLTINSGGSLTLSGGTLTVGCTGNNNALSNSGTLTVSGGTLAVNGNIANANGSTFAQSSGNIIIDGNDNFNTSTSVASGTPLLGFGTSSVTFSTGAVNLTGGTLTIVDPHTAGTNTSAYALYANLGSSVSANAATAHTLRFGDGTSSQQGGNSSGFYWNGYVGFGRLNLGNVIVNNPSGTNRAVTQTGTNAINGNLTVTAGTFSQGTSTTNIGGNVLVENSGIFLTGGTVVFASTTGTTTGSQTSAQSVSVTGGGLIQNLSSSPTANFTNLTTNNTSATGVTINSLNQIIANSSIVANVLTTLTFSGKISTPAGKGLLGGTATTPATTITINSGGMTPGSGFARGWNNNTSGTQFTGGSQPNLTANNFHPLMDANGNGRYIWIERVTPSAAGILMVTYNDVAAGDIDPGITESSYTVNKRSAGKWTVSAVGTTIGAATYKIAMTAPAIFGATPTSTEVRVVTENAFVGTHQAGLATPHAQRAGLTLAQLTAQDFYMGLNSNDIPFYSVQTGNWENGTTWNKGTVPSATDSVTISTGTTVTVNAASAASAITVNANGTLQAGSNTLTVTNAVTNNGTVNIAGGTVAVGATITNNSGANINVTSGTLSAAGGVGTGIANGGTFTQNGGTVNVGITDNSVANRRFTNTGTLTVSNGNLNIYGNFAHSGTSFTQSGGIIRIDGNAGGVLTNSVASGTPLFNITSININLTGGTLLIVDPHAATTNTSAYAVYMYNTSASATSLGATSSHTLRLGDGTSTDAGGNTSGFYIEPWADTAYLSFGNIIVNAGSGTNRGISADNPLTATGDVTVNTNGRLTVGALLIGKDLVVNTGGTIINTLGITNTLVSSNDYDNVYFSPVTVAQSITNNGTISNSATTVTANLAGYNINNTSTGGVTLNSPLSVSGTLTLTAGIINTSSVNLLSLGTATAAGTLSGGSATAYINGPFARTFAASRTTSGTYSVATLLPIGKGTKYLPAYIDPTTTASGPVVFKGEAFTTNSGTQGSGVTSLSSNRWEIIPVSNTSLTSAFVRLGDASLTSTSKIIQAPAANGEYSGISSAVTYTSGTPNVITTSNALPVAEYTGYFAYGDLNSCIAPVAQSASFTASNKTTSGFTATFAAVASASHYLVVRYSGTFTPVAPTDYTTYSGSALGGTVVYNGPLLTFNQTGLTPAGTTYTYYVYTYNNSGCYGPVYNTVSPLIQEVTTCSTTIGTPGTPTATATSTSITPSWTASSTSGVDYILEVATNSGFTSYVSGYNNVNIGPVLTATVSGLAANTTYYVRVRALQGDCVSTVSSTLTVKTLCNGVSSFPWTENFDSMTAIGSGVLPSCWSNTTAGTTYFASQNAGTQSYNDPRSAPYYLAVYYPTTASLLWTPPMQLTAGKSYDFSFWFVGDATSGWVGDVLQNTVADAAGATALGSSFVVAADVTLNGTNYTKVTRTFVPSVSGTYYFGVKAYASSTAPFYMGFDDFSVEESPATITSFTPAAVCSSGGETITITGTNFTGATGVKFNGVNAASFTVVNATTITAVTPAGVTTGNVSVVGHVNTVTSTTALTVTATPVVQDITGGNTALCSGSSVQLVSSSSAGTGVWTSSNEAIAHVDINSGLVTAISVGTATITYTATNGSCSAFKTTSITVNDIINITSFTSGQTITPGDSTQFSVTATGTGLTYQWYVSVNGGTSYAPLSNGGAYSGVTTSVLSVNSVDETFNGYFYHVVITGTAPCLPVTSDDAILGVSDIGITTQPQGVTICGSGNVEFTVVAEGSGLTYKWYENQGSGPQLISNGTVGGVTYSGANTATLSIANAGVANNGWTYYVVVSDAAMAEAISGIASLTVNTPPQVSTNPTNSEVCYTGGTASYTVVATGTGLSYQWQYATSQSGPWSNVTDSTPAGIAYSGAVTATLTVTTTAATPISTYYYRAVVTGTAPCTTATSAAATLTFFTPQITGQPAATGVTVGQSAAFAVATSAPSPTYQWQYATSASGPWSNVTAATPAGTTYSGDTSATLTVNANTTAGGSSYYYRAVVTSGGCSVNSNSAQMTVTDYCIPTFTNVAVSDYVSAMSIATTTFNAAPAQVTTAPYYSFLTGGANTGTLYIGNTYTANVTVGTSGTSHGVGVWIDLNSDGDFADTGEFVGSGTINSGSSGNISLVIPSGVTPGSKRMRIRSLRSNAVTSGVSCSTIARGNTVDFVVTIATAPDCTGTPATAAVTANTNTFCLSGSATLTATNLPAYVSGITMQWYNSGGAISGATSATYTTPTLTASEAYYLRVTCNASGQFSDSNSVTITINTPSVATTTPGSRCGAGTVTLAATGSAGTTLTWYSASTGGTALGTGTSYVTPSISTTTNYYVEASLAGSPVNSGKPTPAGTGTYIDTTTGVVFTASSALLLNSAVIYPVGTGTVTVGLYTSGGTEIAATGAVAITAGTATTPFTIPLNFTVPAGTGYILRVKAYTGITGIVRDSSGNSFPYTNGNLSVTGGYFGGASTAYYYFYNLSATSLCTSARTAVTATVNTGPALTLSTSAVTTCNGTASSAVTLTAGGADYDTYQWSPSTGVSGNANAGWTFNPYATTTYTLTALQSGGSQCNRTATVTVTVNVAPTALSITPSSGEICSGQSVSLTASGGQITGTSNLGSGVAVNSSTGYPAPYSTYYGGVKHQMLIRASELTAMGYSAGTVISKIGFTVASVGSSFTGSLSDFRIDMGHTSTNNLNSTSFIGGLSNVLPAATVSIPLTGLPATITHTFATPFTWNGTDNIVVQTSYSNNVTGTSTSFVTMPNSDPGFVSTNWYRADGATANAVFTGTTPTSSGNARPNMIITATIPGTITWSPATGLSATTGATVTASPTVTTTYTATVTAGTGCAVTKEVTVTVAGKAWTGAVSKDWNTAGNWCGDAIPVITDNVVIPNVTNKPIISGNITALANTLSIESGAVLTVKEGNSIRVKGAINLTDANTLIVENYASVMQEDNVANTGTGSALVHRNSSILYRNDFTLWSSPVANQKLFQFSPNTLTTRFYSYYEGSDNYVAVPNLGPASTTTFATAASYLIRMPDAQKVAGVPTGTFVPAVLGPGGQDYNAGVQRMIFNGKYSGMPNNGTITFNAATTFNGYNAIGNPYPSPISISAFFAANGNNTDGTIYVWRKKNGAEASAYCTMTADGEFTSNLQPEAENPNGVLQVGQGFIVKASGPIVFNNTMRQTVTAVDSSFFRSPSAEVHRIRLNLYKGSQPMAQMLVSYKTNATMGADPGIDALFINDASTALNSVIGTTAYAIQGRALPFSNQDIVPLQFKAGAAGSYTISLAQFDGLFAGDQSIFLKDKLLNVIHNIKIGAYTFSSEQGAFDNRFELLYTEAALGTDNPVLDPNSIVIWKNDNKLHIDSGVAIMKDIRIFDIRGRLVYEKTGVNASTAEVAGLSVQEEMLIVQVTTVDNAKVSKKVIY